MGGAENCKLLIMSCSFQWAPQEPTQSLLIRTKDTFIKRQNIKKKKKKTKYRPGNSKGFRHPVAGTGVKDQIVKQKMLQ